MALIPGRPCSARSTVPIETSRASAISLMPTGLRLFEVFEEPLLFPRICETLCQSHISARCAQFPEESCTLPVSSQPRQVSVKAADDSLGRGVFAGLGGKISAEF